MTAGTMGDKLRNAVLFRWTAHIPDSDTAARGGGTQFLIIAEKNVQAADDI